MALRDMTAPNVKRKTPNHGNMCVLLDIQKKLAFTGRTHVIWLLCMIDSYFLDTPTTTTTTTTTATTSSSSSSFSSSFSSSSSSSSSSSFFFFFF